MQIKWKRFVFQVSLWLVTEIILTIMGMDDLADYSEYHLSTKYEATIELLSSPAATIV